MVSAVDIGERLKAARDARGLSRAQVAERLKMSVATVQHNENGTRSITIESLADYCRILRVNTDWLVSGFGKMDAPGASDPDAAEVVDLMRNIKDPSARREVADFARFKAGKARASPIGELRDNNSQSMTCVRPVCGSSPGLIRMVATSVHAMLILMALVHFATPEADVLPTVAVLPKAMSRDMPKPDARRELCPVMGFPAARMPAHGLRDS